ncbi:MAG: hypothetical protein MUP22_13920 [Desulfobacterales bacterium]|nr:hypothetical protein [Desulfobacterales bacterium]
MITEKDIKVLKIYETPLGKITDWVVILTPLFLTLFGLFNLLLGSKIGDNVGYDFISLLQSRIKGVDINSQYSGLFLAAMERLTTAFIQISFAFMTSILAYAYYKRRAMDLRILQTLVLRKLLIRVAG